MNTFCSYYNAGICTSCNLLEMPYPLQLQSKLDKLSHLLAFSSDFTMLPPVASANQGFRNKAKLAITGTMEAPILGLLGENDLDAGRDIKGCGLHHPQITGLLQGLPELIAKASLRPYQIKSKTGELKGVIVYYSPEADSMYLRLILRSKESLDRIRKHAAGFMQAHPAIKSLSANIQPVPHAILEGEEEIFFTPLHYIPHKIGDIEMTLHPQGFVQTNQEMAARLYSTAAEWVKELAPQKFMELFSGQGAFSFFIQKNVKEATGIEINQEAVARANQTAQELKLDHLKFIAKDAALVSEEIKSFAPEVILVNPPRRGLAQAVEVIRDSGCRYFIYSSCNAETLAQDILKLKDHYQVIKVQLFDMFPHTEHFETLVLLQATGV